jgi:hypothetical protein
LLELADFKSALAVKNGFVVTGSMSVPVGVVALPIDFVHSQLLASLQLEATFQIMAGRLNCESFWPGIGSQEQLGSDHGESEGEGLVSLNGDTSASAIDKEPEKKPSGVMQKPAAKRPTKMRRPAASKRPLPLEDQPPSDAARGSDDQAAMPAEDLTAVDHTASEDENKKKAKDKHGAPSMKKKPKEKAKAKSAGRKTKFPGATGCSPSAAMKITCCF